MQKTIIRLNRIGKKYLVSHQKPTLVGNILGQKRSEAFWALKKINLNVKVGEKVGILGPNGAGKTTLLKIIAGISNPTLGSVETFGKVVSVMNLEAGFHPDLTGEENIYLNGMLVGMKKKDIKVKFKEIVDFANIGKFIDTPFYTYSEGMKFRLALSVALASNCDILIIDEIFISGDINFQLKTIDAIRRIQWEREVTTLITSHVPAFVWAFANTFYFLNNGFIKKIPSKDMEKMVMDVDRKFRKSMYIYNNQDVESKNIGKIAF
jgi:ABC-type polysaccharide/polyol phosphate transport system ATPase subunit